MKNQTIFFFLAQTTYSDGQLTEYVGKTNQISWQDDGIRWPNDQTHWQNDRNVGQTTRDICELHDIKTTCYRTHFLLFRIKLLQSAKTKKINQEESLYLNFWTTDPSDGGQFILKQEMVGFVVKSPLTDG